MELHKGWIVDSTDDYENKQSELAINYSVNGRYAGQIIKGIIMPDVHLKNDKYFIPDANGLDTITKEDIKQIDII